MKDKAWSWIDDNKDEFIEVSDKIWGYAELGMVEHKSTASPGCPARS